MVFTNKKLSYHKQITHRSGYYKYKQASHYGHSCLTSVKTIEYPVVNDRIILDNSLSPQHLIRLLDLWLVFQHFAPVVHQLYASVLHSLRRHRTQKLHSK